MRKGKREGNKTSASLRLLPKTPSPQQHPSNPNAVINDSPSVKMAKATKENKPLKAKQSSVGKAGNLYHAIAAMDGNAGSPAEFEAENPGVDEVYFKADEDADEVCMTWSPSNSKRHLLRRSTWNS
jgi:hypothetical protein